MFLKNIFMGFCIIVMFYSNNVEANTKMKSTSFSVNFKVIEVCNIKSQASTTTVNCAFVTPYKIEEYKNNNLIEKVIYF